MAAAPKKWQSVSLPSALIAMALFGGLRFETGYDWMAYEIHFRSIDISDSPWSYSNRGQFEIGYHLLVYATKKIGGSVQSVFLLACCLNSLALYRLIKYINGNIFLPLTLHLSLCYLIANFILVRYSLATSFLFLAIPSLLKGSWLRYVAAIAVGSLFHIFILVFLPLSLVATLRPTRIFIFLLLALVIFLLACFPPQDYLGLLDSLAGAGFLSKFTAYSNGYSTVIPATVIAYLVFNVIVFLLLWKFSLASHFFSRLFNIALWLTVLLCFAIIIGYPIPSIWNRIMLVAVPIQAICLASIASRLSIQANVAAMLSTLFVTCLLYLYPLTSESSLFIPYESIFHRDLGVSSGSGRDRMIHEFTDQGLIID